MSDVEQCLLYDRICILYIHGDDVHSTPSSISGASPMSGIADLRFIVKHVIELVERPTEFIVGSTDSLESLGIEIKIESIPYRYILVFCGILLETEMVLPSVDQVRICRIEHSIDHRVFDTT
jgi:hypothetical protein